MTQNHAALLAANVSFPSGSRFLSYAYLIPWKAPARLVDVGGQLLALYQF
jgi:hypothetical protein